MKKQLLFFLSLALLGGVSSVWATAKQLNSDASAISWSYPGSSLTVASGDYVQLDGIKMTIGSADDATTTWAKHSTNTALQPSQMPHYFVSETKTAVDNSFSTTSTLPTHGGFFVFEPTRAGVLTIGQFESNGAGQKIVLAKVSSDGTTIEEVNTVTAGASYQTHTYELESGKKYYFFETVFKNSNFTDYRNSLVNITYSEGYTFEGNSRSFLNESHFSGISFTGDNFKVTLGGSEYNKWSPNSTSSKGMTATFTPNTNINPSSDTQLSSFDKNSTLPVEGIYLVFEDIKSNGSLTLSGYSGGTQNYYIVDATNATLNVLDIRSASGGSSNVTWSFNAQKGHKYYFFQLGSTYNGGRYSLQSVTFTPASADTYTFAATGTSPNFTMTSDFPGIDGIVMELGTQATSTNFWDISNNTCIKLTGSTNDSKIYSNITRGSDGFYIVFKPYKSGLLTVSANGSDKFYGTTQLVKVGDEENPLWSSKEEVSATSECFLQEGQTYYFESNHAYTRVGGVTFTTTVSATTDAKGYTTFAAPYPLDLSALPDGMKAYKAKVSGTKVNFTEVTTAVPANTGLLLEGAASTEYNIPIAASASALAENDFLVNTTGATIASTENTYYFGMIKDSDPLKFGKIDETGFVVPANKAYLSVPAGNFASAPVLSIVFGDSETTGVKKISESSMGNLPVYNLAGQRVSQPQKGLYIVNGKKVVIK
ncbi:MAG: hypothetical protein IJ637_07730 [Prevotella sp.]|nr:hypothetical protein [Prevotella sp.]